MYLTVYFRLDLYTEYLAPVSNHVIHFAPSFSKSMLNDYAWAGMKLGEQQQLGARYTPEKDRIYRQ